MFTFFSIKYISQYLTHTMNIKTVKYCDILCKNLLPSDNILLRIEIAEGDTYHRLLPCHNIL